MLGSLRSSPNNSKIRRGPAFDPGGQRERSSRRRLEFLPRRCNLPEIITISERLSGWVDFRFLASEGSDRKFPTTGAALRVGRLAFLPRRSGVLHCDYIVAMRGGSISVSSSMCGCYDFQNDSGRLPGRVGRPLRAKNLRSYEALICVFFSESQGR
jgi:hypothetical protein